MRNERQDVRKCGERGVFGLVSGMGEDSLKVDKIEATRGFIEMVKAQMQTAFLQYLTTLRGLVYTLSDYCTIRIAHWASSAPRGTMILESGHSIGCS